MIKSIKIGALYNKATQFLKVEPKYEEPIDVSSLGLYINNNFIKYIIKKRTVGLTIIFKDKKYNKLICAKKHILYQNDKEVFASDLNVGDFIDTINGKIEIEQIKKSTKKQDFYDICVDTEEHTYYDEDGVKHHNTVILACLGRQVSTYGRCLIVVPNSDLVLQTYETLNLMGVDCGRLMGQKYREVDKQTVVATWQTLLGTMKKSKGKGVSSKQILDKEDVRLSQEELDILLKDLKCIICDEAHTLTGKEIFRQFTGMFADVPLRYGCTGTVPKQKAEKIYLQIAVGNTIDTQITTKELQGKKFLADSNITVIKLKEDFNPSEGLTLAEKTGGRSWVLEKEYLQSAPKRLDFISKMIASVSGKGNTLVLCTTLKTGHYIENRLKEQSFDVSYIAASMSSKKRQVEYKSVNETTNKIIISTVALASTGIDIPNLNRVVLVDSGKSFTKVCQSLGRGLRLGKDKNKVDIYDIGSDIGSSKNHIKERIKYYKEQGHKLQILEVKL